VRYKRNGFKGLVVYKKEGNYFGQNILVMIKLKNIYKSIERRFAHPANKYQ